MEKFEINGLAGKKKLKGDVYIQGAKNAALKAIASAILFDGEVRIDNVPKTDDILNIEKILQKIGVKTRWKDDTIFVNASHIDADIPLDRELSTNMRASVVLTSPLLSRFHKVIFPSPGGCVIGARPIDLFLKGYQKMGAEVKYEKDFFIIEASKGLRGASIFFPMQSVGATETLMLGAILAKGKTVLKNCAMEPEIISLGDFLVSNGAKIKGLGSPTIEIEGGGLLKAKNKYTTIPDRIEAGSYILLSALCGKDVTIHGLNTEHVEILLDMLIESGVHIEINKVGGLSNVRVQNKVGGKLFKAFNVRTHEYPGFATDLQPQIVTFLTQANGQSIVLETIYESRFKYVSDLISLGAQIDILNQREIKIVGPSKFVTPKNEFVAKDLRAGFAIIMALIYSKGKGIVSGINLIDRGYENIEEKLQNIGVQIKRIK